MAEIVAIVDDIEHGVATLLYDDGTRVVNSVAKMREGGAGSGNFGHAGRKGEVGGSSSPGTNLPHDEQIDKYFNTPEVAKEIQHVSAAAAAKATTFSGVLYHAMKDAAVAHAIVNGETSFYNSQTGYYGAGLYFSTEPLAGEGWSKPGDPFAIRNSYGNERFDTVVSARLCVFSDEEYTQHVTEFCHAVYHDSPIKSEQYEVGQRLMTECLRHQGFDGIQITNPYGKEGVDYIADFNAGRTIKSITLHEAIDSAPALVVLFDDSTIASQRPTWHDERPFED